MLGGYSLRKYTAMDWFLIILTSSFILQIIVTVLSSTIIQFYPELFLTGIGSETEILSNIIYNSAVYATILSLPLTLLVVYWRKIPLFNRKQLSQEESFLIKGLSKEDWAFLIRYIPISYTLYLLGNVVVVSIFGEGEAVNQLAIESLFGYIPIWQLFIMIVLVAPIVEELLFRGMMLFSGNRIETTWLRTIISALLFGLIHSPTNIQSLYTYVGMGFIFAYAAKRTNSVEAAMLYHFLNNLVGFTAIYSLL